MRKKSRLFYLIILLLLFVVFSLVFVFNRSKKESSSKSYLVQVQFVYNNTPQSSVQLNAYNYDEAMKKIRTGKFEKEELDNYLFKDLKKNYSVSNNVVRINSNLEFGKNKTLSKVQAEKIVKVLFLSDNDFLNYINGGEKNTQLHSSTNSSKSGTNKNGKAIAMLPKGYYIVTNSMDDQLLNNLFVKKNSKVILGNTKYNSNITLTGAKKENKAYYTTNYGNEVEYHIPISNAKNIVLYTSPNFVIDSTNLEYTKQYDVYSDEGSKYNNITGNKIALMSVPSSYDDYINRLSQKIEKSQSVLKYNIHLLNENTHELVVKGHVSSQVSYQFTIDDTFHNTSTEENIISEDNAYSQGIIVKKDNQIYYTPQIKSYGINFAMYDTSDNHLLLGTQYALTRVNKKTKKVQLYTSSKKWITLDSKKIDENQLKQAYQFSGNHRYGMDGKVSDIEYDKNIWGYDKNTQKEENSSLFLLRGLSGNYTYNLYQISVPKGYKLSDKPYKFYVDDSSIQHSQYNNTFINGDIIGMLYKTNEYNALGTVPKNGEINKPLPYQMTTIIILIAVVTLSAIISFVLLKYSK